MRFVASSQSPLPFNGSIDAINDDVVTKSVLRRRSSWNRRQWRNPITAIKTTTTSSSSSSLSIFSNVWEQLLPSTMIVIALVIFNGWLLPTTTNDYEYYDSSTTTSRRGIVFVVDAFRLNHYGSHSIGSRQGTNRYHILDDISTFVPTLRHHDTLSYNLPIRSDFSFTSSILQRYMVNFGPYGDFLNSRVNDNDENNDSGNDGHNNHHNSNTGSNNMNQDTQPNPSPITSKNHLQQHQSPHQHHDNNVVFVYSNDRMMDQFYYYYGGPTETTYTESQMNDSRTPSESTLNDNIYRDDNSSTGSTPPPPSQRQWTPSWSSSSSSSSSPPPSLLQTQSLDKMDADMAAGTYRILQIPTTSLKPGGLRLFIVMYVLGAIPALMMMMMHNPNSNNNNPNKLLIWKVDRPSNDEYVIDLYFHDHSAILSIELIPPVLPVPKVNDDMSSSSSSITESTHDVTRVPNDTTKNTNGMIYIHRIGSSPSSMYRIHEATILQGLLQELLICATDPIIPNVQDRLLTLTNTTIQQLHTICDTFPLG